MNIRKKRIERVRITCLSSERDKAWDWLKSHGFKETYSNPRISKTRLEIDGDRYIVEGEREL